MFPLNTIKAWNINIIMNKKYDNNNIIIASRAYFLQITLYMKKHISLDTIIIATYLNRCITYKRTHNKALQLSRVLRKYIKKSRNMAASWFLPSISCSSHDFNFQYSSVIGPPRATHAAPPSTYYLSGRPLVRPGSLKP
jgi:hypothetical protein